MPRVSELHVNAKNVRVDVDAERSLLSVLRDDLALTGCKYGCGEARCGACTVLIDGAPVRSCTMPVGEVGEGKIATIESFERDGHLHPVQQAFLAADAMQCGYCTCGMIVAAVALLEKNANPSDAEIVRAMNGHICRCGVYQRIATAIRQAAKTMRETKQ
jgi:aerobic-type carbon monoxide dehydrogenase small subunit (CoxS/CutS family)